jgi:hypothetical protein
MAVGIAMAALILLFVAIIPLYQNTTDLLAQIKAKGVERDAVSTKVSLMSQLDTNVLASRVQTLDQALPPRKDVLTYLVAIDGLSKQLGLSFGGISLSPGEVSTGSSAAKGPTIAGIQSLDTDIKISGSGESVYTFLRTIEQVLPLMQIKNVKVSVSADMQYQLSLTLGMLWAPPVTVDVKGPITLFTDSEQQYFTQLSQYTSFNNTGTTFASGVMGKQDVFAPFTPQH